MNYVDLEQAERILGVGPSHPDCDDDRGPGFVSWGQFTMNSSGLTVTIVKGKGDSKEETESRVSGAFEVLGRARDTSSRGWGRWLRWRDADGRPHTRHVTDAALQGDPGSLCAMLADEGLHIVRGQQRELCTYLNGCDVSGRVTIVSRTGWHDVSGGRVFVLPAEIIGAAGAERVILDASATGPYEPNGLLEAWRERVGQAVRDHVIPTLAVSTALAGPLLAIANQEGGAVNLFGTSSRGKTTVAQAAASVWGRGSSPGFVRTWRATANGLEGIAASATDTVLVLDELGVVEARDAAAAIYGLANGTGKARAARDGSLRDPKTWRTLILSTGELPIEGKLAEDKGRRAKAGQLVRMLDISADRGLGFGVFDHGGADGDASKIADGIKRAAISNYGTAGPEFVRRLLKEDPEALARHLRTVIDNFVANNIPQGSDGQVIRAAQRLGLIGAAGEIARAFGICPWTEGAAFEAATWALNRWIEGRGGAQAAEQRQAVEQVRRYIEANGEARFESVEGDDRGAVHNRAGWKSGKGDEQEWWVLPEMWKSEICSGMDATAVARFLVEAGMMKRVEGSFQSVRKIAGANRRVYVLTSAILAGAAHA
jgi:putative DNA primase/helicase